MNGSRKQVVIIGGSFGGVNAAYELHRQLGRAADITLIPYYTFHNRNMTSMEVWIPSH